MSALSLGREPVVIQYGDRRGSDVLSGRPSRAVQGEHVLQIVHQRLSGISRASHAGIVARSNVEIERQS